MNILGAFKRGLQDFAGPFGIQPGRLVVGMNADHCFLLENVCNIQRSLVEKRLWIPGESWALFE